MSTPYSVKAPAGAPAVVRWRADDASPRARQHALAQALAQHPGRDILLIRAGLALSEAQIQRWQQHLRQAPASVDGITVLSNADERYNPFSDHPQPPADCQRHNLATLVAWLGDGTLSLAPSFPTDRLLLRAHAARRLAGRDHWPQRHDPQLYGFQLQLADDVYLDDPALPVFQPRPEQRWQAAPSESFARLSADLRRVLDAGHSHLPATDQPHLLHITHSWGGGVNRWLNDWCHHDHARTQLVLRSHGDWQRARHGSQLALYLFCPPATAADQDAATTNAAADSAAASPAAPPATRGTLVLLRTFQLTPPITATRISDTQYRALLEWIVARYQVKQLLVSSLIGHSLDALNSGLPCIYVLHDFYPAWPLLSVNPLPYRQPATGVVAYDLARALREHPQGEFSEDQLEHWQRITQAWREMCLDPMVRLVAPTRAAAQTIGELNPALRDAIHVIPHGLPPWPAPAPAPTDTTETPAATADDGKLRLVVPGRLSRHKGRELLRAALPGLRPYARIVLLGCDRDGMELLGEAGVDVIGRYTYQDLPRHITELRPDAALLLSVVPETFSYTLSEMWALGVVPVATRLGGFAERIDDGATGLLIEPQAEALIAAVRRLHQDHALLAQLRAKVSTHAPADMQHMLAAYATLWPAAADHPAQRIPALPAAGDIAELRRSQLWLEDEQRQWHSQRDQLLTQLQSRTQWARKAQAQSEALRDSLQQAHVRYGQQLRERQETIHQRDQAMQRLRQEQHQLARQLHQQQHELQQLHSQLQQTQDHYSTLQHHHQQVLASRSWRLTRPLRVLTRTGRNLRRARVHLPWRWPWLARRLLQSLLSQGLGGTLRRLQNEPAQSTVTLPAATLSASQDIAPVQLNLAEQPVLGVHLVLAQQPALLSTQLQQIAALQQRWPLAVVVSGTPDSATAAYLQQCSGLLRLETGAVAQNNDATAANTDGAPNHPGNGLAAALAALHEAHIQRPSQWLLLDGPCEPQEHSLEALLKTLHEHPEYAVTGGVLVNRQRQVLAPLPGGGPSSSAQCSSVQALSADHPLLCYLRPLADSGCSPLALDLTRLNIDVDTPLDEIDQRIQQYRARHGILLQPFSQSLWLDDTPPSMLPTTAQPAAGDERAVEQKPGLLVVDAWVPTPDQDSGSLRMVQLLQVAQSLGWHVVFCAADRSHRGSYTTALQQAGIEVWHTPYLHDFSRFLSDQGARFSTVMLSRYYVAQELLPLIRRLCPLTRIVFDTVDLHFLREEREAEVKQSATLKRLAAATRKQELALVENSDITLVVSPVEQRLLRQLRPLARVEVLSNIHTLHGCHQDFQQRRDILFVGGFQHPPNVDAVKWFLAEVWPHIHAALPDVRFRVIGSKMPEEVQQLQAPNVDVLGFVPDLEPHLHGCRLSVAPLRYGAGVKGKINSSMSYGQPVVATTIAVEGMALVDGDDVLVADDAGDFARAVIRLYQDPDLWRRLSQAGLENIRRYFSVEAARERLRAILKPD